MKNKLILAVLTLCSTFVFAQTVAKTGNIDASETWTSDNVYVLTGQVFVKDSVTLTIEAGTTIRAQQDDGQGLAPALVVEMGGKLIADGTKDAPITFTSILNPDDSDWGDGRGLWGGIIINGKAPISTTGGTNNVEGLTGVPYGGTDPDDDSGVLRYVRVWHGGRSIGQDNEINGITLAGVGRGTTVEFCEVAYNLDDGFEMFGGTVDLRNCSVVFTGDDAFDTDEGYQGRGQFLFSITGAVDGDNAYEMDSKTGGNLDSSPRSHPIFMNVTSIGGGANGGHSRMYTLREGTGGTFMNHVTVFSSGDGARNYDNGSEVVVQDLDSTGLNYPDYLYWAPSNLQFGGVGNDFANNFASLSFTALGGDPGVTADGREGSSGIIDPRPTFGSPAYDQVEDLPGSIPGWDASGSLTSYNSDAFFVQAPVKGAFSENLWLRGWSILDEEGRLPAPGETVSVLEEDITVNTTLTNDNVYILAKQVFVQDGATLTIEPGTMIKALPDDGQGLAPALVVMKGGKLIADGTREHPITFTSALSPEQIDAAGKRGLWGGLIINGKAPISTTGGTNNVEGLTGVPYGGTDPDDDSGVLRYVRVWHGGRSIGQDNEINGITLAGVGRGTTVEFCEVAYNLDDGFEMFGGTVDLKYCSVVQVGDDAFDLDEGYQGRGQFLFVKMDSESDRGHEMDNKTGGDLDSQPRTNPLFSNVSILGPGIGNGAGDGVKAREGCGGMYVNYLIVDIDDDGFDNDDVGTEVRTQNRDDYMAATPNALYWSSQNIIANSDDVFGNAAETDSFVADTTDPQVVSNTMALVDPRPSGHSSAYRTAEAVPSDPFFDQAGYRGAFGTWNWLEGWSILDDEGRLGSGPVASGDIADMVHMEEGWNLISLDVDPYISTTFDFFHEMMEDIAYVSSPGGYFRPGDLFSSLGELEVGKGYYVKMHESMMMDFHGADTSINYNLSAGWNLIAYEPQMSMPPSQAFGSLIDADVLEYVSGFDGGAILYDPDQLPFLNTLTSMENGLGYWVKISTATPFEYPVSPARVAIASDSPIENAVNGNLNPTPVYMFINGTVNSGGASLGNDSWVDVKTESGLLVGSMNIYDDKYLVTSAIYGDDPTTAAIDGAVSGEELVLEFQGTEVGSVVFDANQVVRTNIELSDILPNTYALSSAYPNPFNPATTFSYAIPTESKVAITVYDITGRVVQNLVSGIQSAGVHAVTWHGLDNLGKSVASGTYFIRMNAPGFNNVTKVMFMK